MAKKIEAEAEKVAAQAEQERACGRDRELCRAITLQGSDSSKSSISDSDSAMIHDDKIPKSETTVI
jgi:hypothetical protein